MQNSDVRVLADHLHLGNEFELIESLAVGATGSLRIPRWTAFETRQPQKRRYPATREKIFVQAADRAGIKTS